MLQPCKGVFGLRKQETAIPDQESQLIWLAYYFGGFFWIIFATSLLKKQWLAGCNV
jgi:hypothetical protein